MPDIILKKVITVSNMFIATSTQEWVLAPLTVVVDLNHYKAKRAR